MLALRQEIVAVVIVVIAALGFFAAVFGIKASTDAIKFNTCVNAFMGDDSISPQEVIDICDRKIKNR